MIGNGIDIIEIDRIQEACLKWGDRFLNRIYTQQEQNYCRGRFPQLAARFAALKKQIERLCERRECIIIYLLKKMKNFAFKKGK